MAINENVNRQIEQLENNPLFEAEITKKMEGLAKQILNSHFAEKETLEQYGLRLLKMIQEYQLADEMKQLPGKLRRQYNKETET